MVTQIDLEPLESAVFRGRRRLVGHQKIGKTRGDPKKHRRFDHF